MDAQVKQKTLELLRSGTIQQRRGQLKDNTGCRCVLGVIALAGDIPHDTDNTLDDDGRSVQYRGFERVGLANDDCITLFRKNDRGAAFPELADFIEENF